MARTFSVHGFVIWNLLSITFWVIVLRAGLRTNIKEQEAYWKILCWRSKGRQCGICLKGFYLSSICSIGIWILPMQHKLSHLNKDESSLDCNWYHFTLKNALHYDCFWLAALGVKKTNFWIFVTNCKPLYHGTRYWIHWLNEVKKIPHMAIYIYMKLLVQNITLHCPLCTNCSIHISHKGDI